MNLQRKATTVIGTATASSVIAGTAAFAHGAWWWLLMAELATILGVLALAYLAGKAERNRG